ncbi:MAG: SH3 domain-containing protein, partial [Endomicrobium sp.]|nr:SH3 domain-containing protein [Endomicrobium sp.]
MIKIICVAKLFFALGALVIITSCASPQKNIIKNSSGKTLTICPAPTAFQDVDRIMKSPGYWISKLQYPDKIALNKQEIDALNAKTVGRNSYINDIRYFQTRYYRKSAADAHRKNVAVFSKYYDGYSDKPVEIGYFEEIEKNIDYSLFSSTVAVKFAMTVKYAELRVLPTRERLFSSLDTLDLDRMQITQLDLASPLAVLYSTKDKEWHYVVSEIAEGWIEKDSFAFCKQETIRDYKKWTKIAVTVSPKSDIYKNSNMTDLFDYVNMGTVVPIANVAGDVAEIRIPSADSKNSLVFKKAYISLSDISIGYLKYTQRNVLIQAFKHLNSPYGWGGMNGEQDCSSF